MIQLEVIGATGGLLALADTVNNVAYPLEPGDLILVKPGWVQPLIKAGLAKIPTPPGD